MTFQFNVEVDTCCSCGDAYTDYIEIIPKEPFVELTVEERVAPNGCKYCTYSKNGKKFTMYLSQDEWKSFLTKMKTYVNSISF